MSSPRHDDADACPAVIVGCGLAGIAAAAALRRGGHSVVVLEQDNLPPQPVPRRRVPQAGHLHNLLTRGQIHMEELLPGFRKQLRAAGAREVPVAAGTRVFEFGIAMPARDLGLRMVCAPRPLIEHIARRLLQERWRCAYPGGCASRTARVVAQQLGGRGRSQHRRPSGAGGNIACRRCFRDPHRRKAMATAG